MATRTAKTTKQELKAILKQCLKEILEEEGLLLAEGRTSNPRVAAKETVSTPTSEDVVSRRLQETVNEVTRNFEAKGGSEADMMRNIFADTALTTLQEQQANGHSVATDAGMGGMPSDLGEIALPPSPQQRAKDTAELEALSFGGDTSRWAAVAFAGKR